MGTASYAVTSFLGGEWSPQMQGRFDLPDYRTALNVCLNNIPLEEGAIARRSGTRLGGITRNGGVAVLREFHVNEAQPFDVELSDGYLRLWSAGAALVTYSGSAVTNISGANPAQFTSSGHGLTTGDQVVFTVDFPPTSYAGIAQVLGRQFKATRLDDNTFTLADALTDTVIDGSTISFDPGVVLTAYKVYEQTTVYSGTDLQNIRIVQDGDSALLLHRSYPIQQLTITTDAPTSSAAATIGDAVLTDGPYLDIPSDGTTLTPSATSGTITFTASSIASINDGSGFQATDVGRQFRIFSEPLSWASGTSYSIGNVVKEAGVYWKAVAGSTGVQPSTDDGTRWVIDTTAAAWTWGTIATVSSTTVFTATLAAAVTYPDNVAGGDLLYTNAATAWQLGAYSDTTGYPSCGAYYQGRVWLGGAIPNRFDACVVNDFDNGRINFAPTGADGTVADNNGISGTLNSKDIEDFLWMLPTEQGVLAGTQGGEWLIASSGSTDPITPTSILTRESSHYGSANVQAIQINRASVFVHRDQRKVYEYMANYFTQKFVADNLSLKAKHLTVGGVAEIAYMRELTPVIWCRLADGTLIGCTYKHDDPIKPLDFAAWHRHVLGTGRKITSIQGGPANGGQTDTLAMVTHDTGSGYYYVEFLQTVWDSGNSLADAWYVDGGIAPAGADRVTAGGVEYLRIYGLWYMAGETITAWASGLDLGDFTVSATGTIDLPINVAGSLFTDASLTGTTAAGSTAVSSG